MSVFGVETFTKTFNAKILKDLEKGMKDDSKKPPSSINPTPEKPKPVNPQPEEEREEQSCGVLIGSWNEWSSCFLGNQYQTMKVKATIPDWGCAEPVSNSAENIVRSLRSDGNNVGMAGYWEEGFYVVDIVRYRNCTVATNEEEEPVDVDDGTITDDSTEEEPVDSSGDGESSTVEEEEQQDDEEEDEEDDSAIGGGGSFEDTDSDLIQGVIGDGISSAVGGFFSKALIGVGVILGAGYAYENREKIANYFQNMS